ncbi:MAG: hypothetical protein ABIG84_00705 [archaeon]
MADIQPRKIEIRKDIPTGKTLRSESDPFEIPLPPKPPYRSQAPGVDPKSNPRRSIDMELPPLPADLKPSFQQPKEFHKNVPPQASALSSPPVPPPLRSSLPPLPDRRPGIAEDTFHAPDLGTVEVNAPAAPTPLQKEVRRRISQVKGPVFISLERYREVKDLLSALKGNSRDLRAMVEEFKGNKKEGTELLSKSVGKLENIEEAIENINSTLRT